MAERIAVVASRFYKYGGIPRVVTELVSRLENIEGLEFDIVTARTNYEWSDRIDSDVREISTYPHPILSFFNPVTQKRLNQYDMVWIQNTYLNRLSTLLDVPTIATFHPPHRRYGSMLNSKTGFQTKLETFLQTRGLRYLQYTDRVVGISDQVKKRLTEHYKADAVRIYHGGDEKHTGFSSNDEYYIFAFSVDDTIKRLAKDYPVKSLSSHENIERVNGESDKELFAAVKNSSFVITGAFLEGFGLEPIEAAFCGKSTVARAVGGHEETIHHGETGYLADNTAEFRAYVEELWSDEDKRKAMGEKAFDHAEENFTWERAARQYLEEFNDLLGREFQLD